MCLHSQRQVLPRPPPGLERQHQPVVPAAPPAAVQPQHQPFIPAPPQLKAPPPRPPPPPAHPRPAQSAQHRPAGEHYNHPRAQRNIHNVDFDNLLDMCLEHQILYLAVNEDTVEKNITTELVNEHCTSAPHEFVDIQSEGHYLDDICGYSREHLQRAFYEEYQKLTDKELYEEVQRTSLTSEQQKQIVKTRWVVSDRPGTSGQSILKARFVAKGYSQYVTSDSFAATPASTSLRALLMLSIISGWNVTSRDISSAIINTPSYLKAKNIWVEAPVEVYGRQTPIIWRLKKAMYGLKMSPHLWQRRLTSVLENIGFTQSRADRCLFTLR